MTSICVRCYLQGSIVRPPMLDSLLMAMVALRDGYPPVDCNPGRRPSSIEIPIEVEPKGRFHLCSSPQYCEVGSEIHYKNRRFPVEVAGKLGDPKEVNRVRLSAGAERSYRIPHSVSFLVDSLITWWVLGDARSIRDLLRLCKYVGKFRDVGKGKVQRWDVSDCESWEGFPVLLEGRPMRPLPLDWPGLKEYSLDECVLSTIGKCYWDHTERELCAVF